MSSTVRLHKMKLLVALLLVYISALAVAEDERTWVTEIETLDHHKVLLHWTTVWEGKESIYKISTRKGDKQKSIDVFGQPVFSPKLDLVALPDCSDDGCSNEITIVNIIDFVIVEKLSLPLHEPMDISCNWIDSKSLKVEANWPTEEHPTGISTFYEYTFR